MSASGREQLRLWVTSLTFLEGFQLNFFRRIVSKCLWHFIGLFLFKHVCRVMSLCLFFLRDFSKTVARILSSCASAHIDRVLWFYNYSRLFVCFQYTYVRYRKLKSVLLRNCLQNSAHNYVPLVVFFEKFVTFTAVQVKIIGLQGLHRELSGTAGPWIVIVDM